MAIIHIRWKSITHRHRENKMNKLKAKIEQKIREKTQFTLQEIESIPTLIDSHFDDLKINEMIEGVKVRVWLSRCTVADGMPYDNQVTVEYVDYDNYSWERLTQYEAK